MNEGTLTEAQVSKMLVESIDALDITPTMFKEAKEHYLAIGNLLVDNGIECDVSAYGSIATGTVVKPLTDDDESFFDFDVLCRRTDIEKRNCLPIDVRDPVENVLANNGCYAGKVDVEDECLTIRYVQNGKDGGFRLDICPCVENAGNERGISECETYPLYAASTVSIATAGTEWLESNPDGLTQWFKDKNERFASFDSDARMRNLFEKSSGIYASIEDVPLELDRSSLQRAVQIAKRSRDVYFREMNTKKPPSCALMVLIGKSTDNLSDSSSPLDILRNFITTLKPCCKSGDIHCRLLIKCEGAWCVENPVYHGNLLTDDWTDADTRGLAKWLDALADDLLAFAKGGKHTECAKNRMFGGTKGIGKASSAAAVISGTTSPQIGHRPWASER